MKKILFLFAVCLFRIAAWAQVNPTSADIYLGIRKLKVLGSVLYIAAHPDDENTRLMTYFSKDRLYRTGYLSLTRGDGGQNLIGQEQGVELGLIRTQELLSARKIDGAEQFFSRAFDFGYSKTPEETFTKWDREKILSDVVWVIRKFQPDVIITRFPTTGEGGHGHHTASAILANEAFTAAADPTRFPEQLQYVSVWQAKRILWNAFNTSFSGVTEASKIDVGGYNPILGKSYGEISAESRSQHKSQGFGATRTRGEAFEYFRLTGGNGVNGDPFSDVNTSWTRMTSGANIDKLIDDVIASFDFMQPQKSVTQLVSLYRAIKALPTSYWRDQKLSETKKLIEEASGLWIDAYSSEQYAVQGDSVRINFVWNDRMGIGARLKELSIDQQHFNFDTLVARNRNLNITRSLYVPDTKEVTQPYWLQHPMMEGYFNVTDQLLIGQPDVQPSYIANCTVVIGGETFVFSKPVRYKFTDQVKGELYEPLVVLPKYTVDVPRAVTIIRKPDDWREQLEYTAQRNLNATSIYREKDLLVNDRNPLPRGGRRQYNGAFDLGAGPANPPKDLSFHYFEDQGKTTAKELHTIRYEHIPYISYFTNAVNHYVFLDVKTYGKKIGYIVGAGDKVPEALEQMGYEVTLLGEKELSRNNLQQYDAIIAGVRALNTNDWMNQYYEKLMEYVSNGGNYIVQYSQANNIRTRIGPYPFVVSGKRITDENAVVSFLRPEHQVLNFPNKITSEDFKGWIQERSIYHADKLDSNYQTILRMNDPGEGPDDGSLVIAKYGKGYFTYTGLVFFRELPAGVPGAYRLFANIIALNRKKEF